MSDSTTSVINLGMFLSFLLGAVVMEVICAQLRAQKDREANTLIQRAIEDTFRQEGVLSCHLQERKWEADCQCPVCHVTRTLIAEARMNAAAEMRERCAKVCEDQADGHNVSLIAVSAPVIRALPLPPAEESFLREKIERAIEAGRNYQSILECDDCKERPAKPTAESILAEAAKERT